MYRILYNPLAAHGQGNRKIELLKEMLKGRECLYEDIREVNYTALCKELKPNDRLVVAGGDGTLNRFVNAIGDNLLENEIYYFAAGSGNDFYRGRNEKRTGYKEELCGLLKAAGAPGPFLLPKEYEV